MATDPCAQFGACEGLDGQVILQRTAYGPTLVSDTQSLAFGGLALRGAAVRPYVDLHFALRWVSKDLCYGPIASIMTLAPGETVTIATRSERRTSFTDLVRTAANNSSVSTHTRQGPTISPGSSPADKAQLEQLIDQEQQEQLIELKAMHAKGYGSFLSDLGDAFVAAATGGASLVADGVADAVNDLT